MKKTLLTAGTAGLLAIFGCVNIPSKFEAHITIDIRHHVEAQAASTLDFIEGKSETLPKPTPAPPPPPPTAPKPAGVSWLEGAWQLVDPMPTAYAAELKTTSDEFTRLAGRLRERNAQVQQLKTSKTIGEDNRGYVAVRDPEKTLSSEKRNEAQRLVAAENKDRKDLYQEVARLNKDRDLSVSAVERIYATERLKRAKSGELVQLPAKGADFEAFKASPAGQALGTACEPEAWVTIK